MSPIVEVGMLDKEFKLIALWGEAGSFLLFMCHHARVGFYVEIVSQLLLPFVMRVLFLIHPVGSSRSVSGFLSEGGVSHVAVDSFCPWEEVSLGTSNITILQQPVVPIEAVNLVQYKLSGFFVVVVLYNSVLLFLFGLLAL